jgi:hypothetical protein
MDEETDGKETWHLYYAFILWTSRKGRINMSHETYSYNERLEVSTAKMIQIVVFELWRHVVMCC